MSRSLDFGQAMAYPFRKENWKNTLLWPGLIILAAAIILYAVNFVTSIMFLPSMTTVAPGEIPPDFMITQLAIQSVLQMFFVPFLMGYGWHMIYALRQNGYDAAAPAWTFEKVPHFWWDGFKLMIWSYVLSIPYFLVTIPALLENDTLRVYAIVFIYMIVMLFITPLIWSAIVQACETRGFVDLVNFPRIFHAARLSYGKALLANLAIYVFALVSIPVMILGCCCTLGIGYGLTVAWLTFFMVHLFTQAFDAYREPPPETKGYKRH